MDSFVQRSSQRFASSQASSTKGKAPLFEPYHSAASKQLARAQAATSASSTPSSFEASPASSPTAPLTHEYPENELFNAGIEFDINWDEVWRNGKKLVPYRLGYRVKHMSQLRGGRETSAMWKYGADLQYREASGELVKIWLCKACHLQRDRNAAKTYNGNRHIVDHLKRVHRIGVDGSLLSDPARPPSSPWEVAANVAGANRALSHQPWAEGALQSALIDWAILKDISFLDATSLATRALLTWNRVELLAALPSNPTTLSRYVKTTLEERKQEIEALLQSARSKVAVSVDVWTSGNHLSFMAVVGHFVGRLRASFLIRFST